MRLLLWVAALCRQPAARPAAASVVVDTANTTAPATLRGQGFLWSVSATEPPDALLAPLRPKLQRGRLTPWDEQNATGLPSYPRLADLGATIQVQVSGEYANLFDGYANIRQGQWPGDGGNWSLWDHVLEDSVRRVRAANLTVQWDIWEEPNWHGWWNASNGSQAQFFETWRYAVRRLRTIDPMAQIVGPSLNKYDPSTNPPTNWLQPFLLFAQQENVLPDILTWHEILPSQGPRSIAWHAEDARSFMRQHGIAVRGIGINEVGSSDRQTNPGLVVWYLASLEAANVSFAARACWQDDAETVNNCRTQTLDGILTPHFQPRATYWAYRRYAELAGELISVAYDDAVDGIASLDHDAKAVRLLLGRNGNEVPHNLIVLKNLDRIPWLAGQSALNVTAHRIPNTGWDVLETPIPLKSASVAVTKGSVTLHFPEFVAGDALSIDLVPQLKHDDASHGAVEERRR
eukprot:COSAG04_NODE_622_length_11834_cov_56.658969_5_plen_461_part_00